MSRLDRHVNLVRNKLAMGTLLKALAWALLGFAFVVLLNVLVDRFLVRRLPNWFALMWVGLGVTIGGAVLYTIWRRPTARQAAVVIDDRLGLKEKFSTALYVRSSTDPFAAATVRDAEFAADHVSLRKRIPVPFPRAMIATITLIVVTLLMGRYLPAYPLFDSGDVRQGHENPLQEKRLADTRKLLRDLIKDLDNAPALTPAARVKLETARQELQDNQIHDQVTAQRRAQTAIDNMHGILDKLKEIQDKALRADSSGPGMSGGGPRPQASETPVGFQKLVAGNVADSHGAPVTTRLVKAPADKGTSRVTLHDVVQAAEKDGADEVDQDRISRPEQAVVKRYFDDLNRGPGPASVHAR